MQNRFKVTKQYGRGSETAFDVRFNHFKDAKAFVEIKLLEDAAMNVRATYRVYEYDEMHTEFDPAKIDIALLKSQHHAQESQGSQGKGSTASFRPTPLNTAPRPPGTPQKWSKEEDEEEGSKK